MPVPKMLATLNNCALHLLTPEIKREVALFGENKSQASIHAPAYEQLKKEFARYYKLSNLDWKQFAAILNSYNEHDVQIVLGPVLRKYMQTAMESNRGQTTRLAKDENPPLSYENYVTKYTQQDKKGRYSSLEPEMAFYFAAKPLGINLNVVYPNKQAGQFDANQALGTVSMHHQGGAAGAQEGGHWERSNVQTDIEDYSEAQATQLQSYLPLLGSDDPQVTSVGLHLLQMHVRLTAQKVGGNKETRHFNELDLTTAQIEKYLRTIPYLPQAMAEELLGPNITPETKAFISKHPWKGAPIDPFFEKQVRAVQAGDQSSIDPLQQKVITQLLAPVELPRSIANRLVQPVDEVKEDASASAVKPFVKPDSPPPPKKKDQAKKEKEEYKAEPKPRVEFNKKSADEILKHALGAFKGLEQSDAKVSLYKAHLTKLVSTSNREKIQTLAQTLAEYRQKGMNQPNATEKEKLKYDEAFAAKLQEEEFQKAEELPKPKF